MPDWKQRHQEMLDRAMHQVNRLLNEAFVSLLVAGVRIEELRGTRCIGENSETISVRGFDVFRVSWSCELDATTPTARLVVKHGWLMWPPPELEGV